MLDSSLDVANSLKNRLMNKLEQKLEIDLATETLDYDQIMAILQPLTNMTINIAEVKRKVFNGKELLKIDPLNSQERAMLDLLRTVNTPDKKGTFS